MTPLNKKQLYKKDKYTQEAVDLSKQQYRQAISEARKSSKELIDSLEENHIHIRLYKAAGGRLRKRSA